MPIDQKSVRTNLKSGNLEILFREDLGWNRYRTALTVIVEGHSFTLAPIAERNGMAALCCEAQGDSKIPEYRLRRKIEQEVTKQVQEHLIVFTDGGGEQQVWQWVKREPGKPAAYREHAFDTHHQSGEALVQKLRSIAFDLDEEEFLTLTVVTGRVRAGFDVEKVTKKFYELFRKQHADFLKSIQGIDLPDDRAWYTSVMLNRLMFVYFIQKKKFLDNDEYYLRNRLKRVQAEKGAGHFYDFYRYFLLRLFHEGLGQKPEDRTPERNAELESLLGRVPYLNGGIFAPHSLEERYSGIQIEDSAFENIFNFFDDYHWHLDERPLRDDKEINPDVLGYIFEKYINQKEMGAYYTKEDITEYIGRNTILPYLFDAAQPECAIAFREDGSVWRLLRENPDRYIFDAVQKGVSQPLPANIEAGVTDVAKRDDWNRPAPEEFALPTEIWREVIVRRQRCAEVHAKLADGEIHNINDLITYNLDIRQFAQDVIEQCEGPELLRAFWKALQSMRVLDPTVGSGAFLFAALNILEPLYEAVLERMEAFVSDTDRADPTHAGTKFPDFRQTLERIDKHPNRKHFIYKTIIVNNLFGVDIMEEATEICKLRLFLKLVAQVENVGHLEPLPDIDFNIRAGNTLVGYAQIDDIDRLWTATGRLAFERDRDKLELMAKAYSDLLHDFRDQQLGLPVPRPVSKKDVERAANQELRPELDKDLWRLYRTAGKVNDKMTLAQFRSTHNPLHWFVEFPEVMAHGGFDAIIGNPPYIEYSKVKKDYQIFGYKTEASGNLYAFVAEKSFEVLSTSGRLGLIIPISFVCTQRMEATQTAIRRDSREIWVSDYAERPSKLFAGAEVLLTIALAHKGRSEKCILYTTGFTKWTVDQRPGLFQLTTYCNAPDSPKPYVMPKISSALEPAIMSKLMGSGGKFGNCATAKSANITYYRIGGGRYWKVFTTFQPKFVSNGMQSVSSRENYLYFDNPKLRDAGIAVLSSTLFYWYFVLTTNCRDLNPSDLREFPPDIGELTEATIDSLAALCSKLMREYMANSQMKDKTSSLTGQVTYQEFYPRLSKPTIDEIDRVLATHYGFTGEELDFIINYDIKYRMGRGSEDESEE